MSDDDEFAYIRNYYKRSFYKGQRVRTTMGDGVVVGATLNYVRVRLDGLKHADNWHPANVEPLDNDNAKDNPQ